MVWHFGTFSLDPDRHELSRAGEALHVEPQVFALLAHLLRHRDRMVGKEELAAAVWPGGQVSDASIASRVRAARAALDDDGKRQEVIRTLHGVGFRFVAPVTEVAKGTGPLPVPQRSGRPSIAVLPLRALGGAQDLGILAEAIPHEIIAALSRLRWLAVTARGSSFRFRQVKPDFDLVATSLGVRYVLSGLIEGAGRRFTVTLELADCTKVEVIWADRIVTAPDALDDLRHSVIARIVAALELHIPENEARAAMLRGSDDYDAWANYHLGLRHLYRFTATDNAVARAHFERATSLDPDFARAEAGMSFTAFIDAFLRITPDVAASRRAAWHHAERGVELDPLDPFVNFVMGRAHWLVDDAEGARHWLARATDINPNYAQGHYARAFTSMLIGDGTACEAEVVSALALSPVDPLLYGMYGVRSQMLMQQGDYAAAAHWAERAALTPGAHHLIPMIAVAACGLAGAEDAAIRWSAVARAKRSDVTLDDYLRAFPLRDDRARQAISATLRRHGF